MADDDGTFTTGTVVTKAFVDQVYDQLDDQAHSTTNPTVKPKATTDEVILARGSLGTLDARLDVSLNEDGTPKAVAGQATETEIARVQGQHNLVANGEMEWWDGGAAVAPRGWQLAGASAAVARSGPGEGDTTVVNAGQYAAKVTQGGGGALCTLTNAVITASQMTRWTNIRGRKLAVAAQVRTSVGTFARIVVDDGVTTTASAYHVGDGTVVTIAPAVHTLSLSATKIDVYLEMAAGHGNQTAYVGGLTAVFSDVAQTNWIPDATRMSRTDRFGGSPLSSNLLVAETDLALWSIPPLDIDGEGFDLHCDGSMAATANTKTLRLDIAGQKLTIFATAVNTANNIWVARLHVARRSATVVEVSGFVTLNAATGVAPTLLHIGATITALDMTHTQLAKLTGQSNTASADIVLRNYNGLIDRS